MIHLAKCRNGHDKKPGGPCRACARTAVAKYRAKNLDSARKKDRDRAKQKRTDSALTGIMVQCRSGRHRYDSGRIQCDECKHEATIRWRLNNSDKTSLSTRNYRLKKIYGIDRSRFDQILLEQNGRCAICRTLQPSNSGREFHVDHDHLNGRIRGLLCHGCNTMLGLVKENRETLLAAVAYLEHSTQRVSPEY